MKQFILILTAIGIGLISGYIAYPLINPQLSLNNTQQNPIVSTQTMSYELSETQIKDMARKIAPAIAEHLIASGFMVNSDAEVIIQQQENIQVEKEKAFSQAQQIVDQMILNKSVTATELNNAIQLLTQTDQEEKSYLLHARIAVAVNNGELTLQQAGLTWSE